MKCIIVDTDGTIADCEHRRHYLDTKNWAGFFGDMHLDTVIEHTRIVIEALRADGYKIVIVTARPDDADYRVKTEQWYADNNIHYDALYMRAGGDYRKDSIVKLEILQQVLDDGYEPVMALDDRKQVVDMWRAYGLPCMQVNDGDFDAVQVSRFVREVQGQVLLDIMVGPSGAGKSTYIEKNYKTEDVVSTDAVRKMMFGSFTDRGNSPDEQVRVWSYVHAVIKTRLEHGLFTVLDATNIRDKDRKAAAGLIPAGVLGRYVLIDREYDQKVKDRGWRPETLVAKHHNTFKANLKNILKGDNLPNIIVSDQREHKI